MNILSIETSTETASCAVMNEDVLLGEITFNKGKQHSVILMNMIDELLKSLGLTINDIEGYVVSKGPGSFTGLRIGMATVKGLSFGTNKNFVSVSTLDALSYNLAYSSGIICPIIDALRKCVYTSVYKFEDEKLIKLEDYMAISIEDLAHKLNGYGERVHMVGEGLTLYKDYFKNNLNDVCFAPIHLNIPKASSLGEIGLKLLINGDHDDLNVPNLLYINKPQAERDYEKKMGKLIYE